MNSIAVYGAGWCGDTQATLSHLKELGVPFEYHDIDAEEGAAEWVLSHNSGKRKLPTVQVGSQILTIPEHEELDEALKAQGLLN